MNEKLRALYKGALQGSTMGLADEAIGGVGALYARALNPELFQGDSFSNTYAQARDLDRAENKQLEQNNPWTYGGANLVGGVAMPMGMAGQGLKGAVKAGGIAGGLTGYGMSENTNPYALALDTATGAGLGAGAGAALYGAGKVATNPQVQKFAKDYIADESGALTIGGKKFYRGVSGDFPDKEFTFWTPSKKEAESYASGSALTNNGTNKVILERIFEGGKGKNIDEEILETIMDGFEYNGKIIDDPDEVAKIIMDREGLDWVEFMHPSADGGEDHIVRVVRKK